ncbi:MAG: hypothetical protein RLZ98_2812 [Pseudomonadota bacterium]|jgi:NADH-quinone oxidoreductase subunit N
MTILGDLLPIWPELLLCCGAMVLLMAGVFAPDTERTGEAVGWLAILVMVVAGVLVAGQPAAQAMLFCPPATPEGLADTFCRATSGTAAHGSFVVDPFARVMKLLVLAGSALGLLLSFDDFKDHRVMKFEYPVLVLLAATGMMIMVSANDLISLYVGLELQSLSLYVMACFRRDNLRSSEAGLKYFVLGALSSGMLLYGASLLYGFTGTTSFAGIAQALAAGPEPLNIGLVFGMVFLLVGIAFKISAVPFHMWTPDVYEGAPTPVTAFFSAAPKVAAVALLVRVLFGAMPGAETQWQQILAFLAIASMLLGAFAAIGQNSIKRLMAYSSIANVGFALVGLVAGSQEGVQGVVIYMAIYLAMTLGVFACILSMRRETGAVDDINELAGLAQTNLPMAFALGILMFSLAGIPPLAGFWAKYFVFLPAIKEGLYWLAVIGVLASVVGAFYYLRIVKLMFFDEPKERFLPVRSSAGFVMAAAALFMLLYTVVPAPLVKVAEAAAASFRY